MTLDSLLNGMKSLFSSLGAKTSDSNYGVALLDKTSGEPKGLMGMSDLASVLGANIPSGTLSATADFNNIASGTLYIFWASENYLNCPSGAKAYGGFVFTNQTGDDYRIQEICSSTNTVYRRICWSGNWHAWKRVTDTIES